VSALVEVAYMSNPSDLNLLLKEQIREDVAAAIYQGIMEYFKK
jgi:N-acetylmuramoyl-L-alanine amidase